jgi:membrane-bound metal-dependent hydrolase YbcI (DUF457 family)
VLVPSPIGHALGGLAAAWTVAPRRNWEAAAILAAVAIAPDLDLIVGDHRGISHSLGAACAAGAMAWILTRRSRWGAAIALAWASHVLLDWLSNDTRPPIGVMALWPLTHDYYKASIEIFPAVSRRYWTARFWIYNTKAAAVEIAVLGPIAAATILLTARKRPPRAARSRSEDRNQYE